MAFSYRILPDTSNCIPSEGKVFIARESERKKREYENIMQMEGMNGAGAWNRKECQEAF